MLCRVACIFVYAVTGYVCFLLLKYYQAYAILRQRYMTGGEAMINQWTNRICKGDACKRSEDKGRTDSGMRAWNAFRELVDVSAQVRGTKHVLPVLLARASLWHVSTVHHAGLEIGCERIGRHCRP